MRNPNYINSSGYYNPTEGEALDHIIHEERVKERKQRKEKQSANHQMREVMRPLLDEVKEKLEPVFGDISY